tara:strand:- start:1895 stop:2179 length:285 start_codon:yes stop_codon:yes gene_type:complete
MAYQTITQCLSAATDSVNVINDINTNGSSSTYVMAGFSQADINLIVENNVKHLEVILAYDGSSNNPNIVGSSRDKSSYTSAITTGNTYISNNSS